MCVIKKKVVSHFCIIPWGETIQSIISGIIKTKKKAAFFKIGSDEGSRKFKIWIISIRIETNEVNLK